MRQGGFAATRRRAAFFEFTPTLLSSLAYASREAVLTVVLSGIRAQARDDLRSRTITRLAMLAKQECRLIASALCVDDVGTAYPRSVSDEVGGDEDAQHGEDQGDF